MDSAICYVHIVLTYKVFILLGTVYCSEVWSFR